jgi:hypothetical protein
MKHIRIQQDNYNELFYEENNVIEVARLLKYITWLETSACGGYDKNIIFYQGGQLFKKKILEKVIHSL